MIFSSVIYVYLVIKLSKTIRNLNLIEPCKTTSVLKSNQKVRALKIKLLRSYLCFATIMKFSVLRVSSGMFPVWVDFTIQSEWPKYGLVEVVIITEKNDLLENFLQNFN